jgi:hypothetical protein
MKNHTKTHAPKATKKTVTKRYPFTTAKVFSVGSRDGQVFAQTPYTMHDFKNALLIVSVAINLFMLTLWLTTQVSQSYAVDLANFIISS